MNKKENNNNEKLNTLLIWFAVVIIIWGVSYLGIRYKVEDRGTFGDSFGAVNALFSGLAFAGIIYTILLQRKELKLQRDELELTRIELKRTADAQVESNKFQIDQLRLNNLPIFHYEARNNNGLTYFTMENRTQFYAFDVQIMTCISYDNNKLDKDLFLSKNIKDEFRNIEESKFKIDNDGFWNIKNNKDLPIIANKSKLELVFNFESNYAYFQILIQYRDSLNNNYLQILHYVFDADESITLIGIEPKTPETSMRFNEYRDFEHSEYDLIQQFYDFLPYGINDGFLKNRLIEEDNDFFIV